jgi:hypothetical protein
MSKLYDTAINLLKENKADLDTAMLKFVAAVRSNGVLLNELCRDYLERAMADIRHGEQEKPVASRGKTGPHRRGRAAPKPKLPTEAQKKGAIRAAVAEATTFLDTKRLRDGRAIGDVLLVELPRLALGAANKSVTFLSRGMEDAADAILCQKLAQHVQPSSSDAKVRDAIKPEVVEKLHAEAQLMAAQRIADAAARTARELLGSETSMLQ